MIFFLRLFQNLDKRLQSLIRVETTNLETKGQLEFLLNLLVKGGDQIIDQPSDDEQDNDEVKKKSNRIEICVFISLIFCLGRSRHYGSGSRSC